MASWILPWPNDKSDRPNDKLDFTLAKWQVGFYLGQMTSWILPCPNDKLDFRLAIWQVGFYLGQMTSWILDWPNDKLDFTLAKWQVGFYVGQMTSYKIKYIKRYNTVYKIIDF